MGFSIKELIFKNRYLLFLTEQELAGPWFSFKLYGDDVGMIPVILKNIEPTPIYKLVNSRKGTIIDRITLDFDIKEYLKKLIREEKIDAINFSREDMYIRLYIDVFNKPKVPFINTFFTFKNISDYDLLDFNIYFVFDFDINGLEGFDNDLAGYDEKNDIIYQYDSSSLYGGFSPISKSTNFQSCLTKDFHINQENLNLSNKLPQQPGEILSALQIEFKTLHPEQTFQTALTISGGLNQQELINNIVDGKSNAITFLTQVNRNIKSTQRNLQEEAFVKLNLQEARDCE
ncbi:MAG: hypothetical protein BAJALOKI1v1_290011 [Promethearchaeota archaeon]|nr:MAG: hypothetical protein BAJALOKI1v1_290011 [Candidatus Lokiarchaeota archaeon]